VYLATYYIFTAVRLPTRETFVSTSTANSWLGLNAFPRFPKIAPDGADNVTRTEARICRRTETFRAVPNLKSYLLTGGFAKYRNNSHDHPSGQDKWIAHIRWTNFQMTTKSFKYVTMCAWHIANWVTTKLWSGSNSIVISAASPEFIEPRIYKSTKPKPASVLSFCQTENDDTKSHWAFRSYYTPSINVIALSVSRHDGVRVPSPTGGRRTGNSALLSTCFTETELISRFSF